METMAYTYTPLQVSFDAVYARDYLVFISHPIIAEKIIIIAISTHDSHMH